MEDIRSQINQRVTLSGYTVDYLISKDNVLSAKCRLKPSKNDGDRGLFINHFIHGSAGLLARSGAQSGTNTGLTDLTLVND
jgi:hypothetical protein